MAWREKPVHLALPAEALILDGRPSGSGPTSDGAGASGSCQKEPPAISATFSVRHAEERLADVLGRCDRIRRRSALPDSRSQAICRAERLRKLAFAV
jgi:hypothetical protein